MYDQRTHPEVTLLTPSSIWLLLSRRQHGPALTTPGKGKDNQGQPYAQGPQTLNQLAHPKSGYPAWGCRCGPMWCGVPLPSDTLNNTLPSQW